MTLVYDTHIYDNFSAYRDDHLIQSQLSLSFIHCMFMKNTYIVIAGGALVLVAAVIAVFALRAPKSSTESTQMPVVTETMQEAEVSPVQEMMEETPSVTTSESQEGGENMMEAEVITVEGANFKFLPDTITVKKGQKVQIMFKNVEGFHDFVIDEFDVRTAKLQAGGEETVEFTPTEAGTFEYYCSVGTHRQMGMVGTLIVE